MAETRTDPRWRDPDYLRRVQYRDGANLASRANLHVKYGPGDWFAWRAQQFAWPAGASVLEIGCGLGDFRIEAAPHLTADLFAYLRSAPPGADATPAQLAALRAAIAAAFARNGEVLPICKSVGLFICRKESLS